MGPEGSNSPIVTNVINLIMIGLNILCLGYTLKGSWIWLISINIVIGCMTSIFMWCVMFSDPGIQNRNQNKEDLPPPIEDISCDENSAPPMDFTDRRLSLSSFEAHAV